jgi:hypothetical protein
MNPLIQLKKATPLFLVVLACFGLSPMAQALLPPPPPDGGYPGQNTAEGDGALFDLTTGVENTAVGYHALIRTTTGDDNTATGSGALNSNTTGSNNTANGVQALFFNTSGSFNTATGFRALVNNRGSLNTATGTEALFNNTTALFNTAMGYRALFSNTGLSNTANGYQALFRNTIGGFNIALGHQAGMNLTTGSNNIDIGNAGVAGDSNKIRIGKQGTHNGTFIAGISGVAVMGSQVVVNANGRLGVAASSARFKEAIKLMDKASEAIHALKPVTFRYQKGIDPQGIPQFGLVAEDVEKVNRDLVVRDKEGKPYTVRYEAVNAMLLNEFLKEHRKNEEQEATIARQQKQIEAFTAGLQKVSAQLEASKSAPQIVNNR